MNKKKIVVNIFSNWTNFIITILIAFFVSPIIVHSLGNENYGIWTLIVSITGYFTVLDFGVNTAVVRYISMYTARKEYQRANEIYINSFIFFFVVGVFIFVITAVFAYCFKDFFDIKIQSQKYLFFVFFIVGANLAFSFLFSVFLATLSGLQAFLKINVISISTLLINNAVIVIFLMSGYSLVALAIISLLSNLLRVLLQYLIIRKNYTFLKFKWCKYNKSTLKQIYTYSVYSFIISIALKILFFTDSVVIGKFIKISEVTFYAIPAMIMEYVEKTLWTVTAVLIPVISSHDAVGEQSKNIDIYTYGTKYSLIISIPIIFVLFTNGSQFISIWMGEEYGIRATWVLKILLIGYGFSFPQMIAHGVLKGISKHKVFAYILIIEAIVNLVLSIILAKSHGIEGVALGTTIPLIIANTIFIPAYTCYVLNLKLINYLWMSYSRPLFALFILVLFGYYFPIEVSNYFELFLYTFGIVFFVSCFSIVFIIEKMHRNWLLSGIINKIQVFLRSLKGE